MNMMPFYVFASTFVAVFCLGFQSLNVNRGHYGAAMLTSFMIGGSHLVLYKVLPEGDVASCMAYLTAGPLAIASSMLAHERWMPKKKADR